MERKMLLMTSKKSSQKNFMIGAIQVDLHALNPNRQRSGEL